MQFHAPFIVCLLCAAVSSLCVTSVALGATALDLRAAVARALDKSPSLAIQRAQIALERNRSESAAAALYPSVQLDSTLTAGVGDGHEQQSLRHTSGVALVAPLFDGGKKSAQRHASEHLVTVSELELASKQEDLIYSLVEDYTRIGLLDALAQLRAESLKVLTTQRNTLERSYRQGLRLKSDFLSSDLNVKLAQKKLDEVMFLRLQKVVEAKEKLGLAATDDVTLVIPEHPRVSAATATEAVLGQEEILEYKLLDKRRVQEKLDVAGAKLARRPDLNAKIFAGARNELVGSRFFEDRLNTRAAEASVAIEYPLWDWGTRNREVMNALIQEAQADLRLEEGLLRLRRVVALLAAERRQLRSSWILAQDIRQQAEESFTAYEQNYRIGRVSYADLALAHEKLVAAREALMTSEVDLYLNLQKELMLKGQLGERVLSNSP